MIKRSLKAAISIFLLLSITACSTKEDKSFVKSIFQTNGATAVNKHTDYIRESLVTYYEKLNKRNPSYYSKDNFKVIKSEIQNKTNNIILPLLSGKKSASYKDYLNIAGSILDLFSQIYNIFS